MAGDPGYEFREDEHGLWMASMRPAVVAPDAKPPAGMPPLTAMVLDALMDDAETLDTMRDCGNAPPSGLALVGENHLLDALRSLIADGLVEVDELVRDPSGVIAGRAVLSPRDDRASLRRYWFNPTPAGRAVWRGAEAELDAYDRTTRRSEPGA